MKKNLTTLFVLMCHFLLAQTDEFMPKYKYEVKRVAIANDIEIAYVDEGADSAPTMLMIHGLGGNIKNWYPTIDGLSDSFRCLALDLPGYGQSTIRDFSQEDYIEFFANSVLSFVEKLELDEVILLGHSMGGQVSIVVSLENPTWLKQLMLAAPAGFEVFSEEEGAILKQYASADALMNHTEAQIRAAYQMNFVDMPELAEEMIQDRINAKKAPWFADYAKVREMGVRGMLDHPVIKNLDKIQVPTAVIFGKNDQLIPNKYLHQGLTTDQVAEVANKISNVKIKMIEPAGHMLQMDNPANFNRVVKQLLTN